MPHPPRTSARPGQGFASTAAGQDAVRTGIVVHGVDFSGADSGGAAKIRVIERDLGTPRAEVVARGQLDRKSLVRAIQASNGDGRAHLWRIDAPSGLPLSMATELAQPEDWKSIAQWMLECGAPRQWRSRVRQTTRREPRRTCDQAMSTPMAPMNLRVFKQTWTFVCEVLLPLAESGVGIEPMLPVRGARVVVCEGCPASVLACKGWAKRGYKGPGDPPVQARAEIVRHLRHDGMNIPPALADQAISDVEGDVVDALLLATPPFQTVVPREALVESWIY
ncbi:MAG: hypothetical protein JNK53_03135 [Phycisphaerae bacterium]|nr:hypothetical protein [Phycisphaerae bacterium]